MARSTHASYTAADRHERRFNARAKRYSRHDAKRAVAVEIGALR